MTKIQKLTKAQTEKMPEYVEKFKRIGLNTDRLNRKMATRAVKFAYEQVGLELPENVIFCTGPTDANDKISRDSDGEFNVLNSLYTGSLDSSAMSYFSFFRDECNITGMEKMDGHYGMMMYCGWVNLFDTHVYISEKPLHILFDDQERLHCEDGPAILYEDGTTVYSWHGVSVPEKWISEGITPKDALTCDNIEQRRAACEIVGWDSILDELDCEVIHEDGDPEIGTLVSVDIPDIGREKYLRVQCGTGRGFAIPVPPDMKTALEANAWTFGITMEELSQLEVRT